MQDIAAEAGVSAQTVSRVANGSKAVKPETRQRVEEAMAKLGYRRTPPHVRLNTAVFRTSASFCST